MPLTKVDYSKTVIYKIQHHDNDELLYVGSTTDFTRRKAEHKRRCYKVNDKCYNLKLYSMIRDNGGFDCFNMTIIKEFPCQNKREAEAEEDKVIREARANMNGQRAYVTPEDVKEQGKQYRLENKDKLTEQKKQYYEQNKEKITEKNKRYREQNRDEISEQRKQYYEQNKEKVAVQNKRYCEQNKGKKAERDRKYYEENKEQIAERMKQKIICECGSILRKSDFPRHQRSKKHQDFLNMLS
jgi:hypothetical protein